MQGINLGRYMNKYEIIDIFAIAGEEDIQLEAEVVLWAASRRHKRFLAKNYDWYPLKLTLTPWQSLKKQSEQLESFKQGQFLFDHIRICDYTAVEQLFEKYNLNMYPNRLKKDD